MKLLFKNYFLLKYFNYNILINYLLKLNFIGDFMAKVKGTNRRTRPKSGYKKPGSKHGRGAKQIWKKR